jgi:spore coat polysaccharide biosynthesis protein SpsF
MAPVRVNAVIQARLSSTRLPGKVLRPLGGRTVLSWVIRAAAATHNVDKVILATSTSPDDDPVAEEATRCGAEVVRGPLDDVLDRFVQAVHEHPCDAVVRLTADCPLHDPAVIAQVVGMWRADPTLDYASNILVRHYPRGLDTELVSARVLQDQAKTATGPHREHVTSNIYTQPTTYRCGGVLSAVDNSDLRVTLDTAEDAQLLEAIVDSLGEDIPHWEDVVALLRARPDLAALNASVAQKKV